MEPTNISSCSTFKCVVAFHKLSIILCYSLTHFDPYTITFAVLVVVVLVKINIISLFKVDPLGPLLTLRELLFSDNSIMTLTSFVTKYWYSLILAAIAVIALMVRLRFYITKKSQSDKLLLFRLQLLSCVGRRLLWFTTDVIEDVKLSTT